MNTMKKTLSALAAVLALAASGMEWSFDGPEPLRSEDGKTVLTGSVTVAEKAGITGNALRFDGKTDFLELALTGDNRPRREMTLSFWVRPEEGCTVLPIVRSPRRDVTFNGTPGFFWFEVHTADGPADLQRLRESAAAQARGVAPFRAGLRPDGAGGLCRRQAGRTGGNGRCARRAAFLRRALADRRQALRSGWQELRLLPRAAGRFQAASGRAARFPGGGGAAAATAARSRRGPVEAGAGEGAPG